MATDGLAVWRADMSQLRNHEQSRISSDNDKKLQPRQTSHLCWQTIRARASIHVFVCAGSRPQPPRSPYLHEVSADMSS